MKLPNTVIFWCSLWRQFVGGFFFFILHFVSQFFSPLPIAHTACEMQPGSSANRSDILGKRKALFTPSLPISAIGHRPFCARFLSV